MRGLFLFSPAFLGLTVQTIFAQNDAAGRPESS